MNDEKNVQNAQSQDQKDQPKNQDSTELNLDDLDKVAGGGLGTIISAHDNSGYDF